MSRSRKYRVTYDDGSFRNFNVCKAGVAKLEAKQEKLHQLTGVGYSITEVTGPSATSDYRCGQLVKHPVYGMTLPCVLDNRHIKNGVKKCAYDPDRKWVGYKDVTDHLTDSLNMVMSSLERVSKSTYGIHDYLNDIINYGPRPNYDVLEIERPNGAAKYADEEWG